MTDRHRGMYEQPTDNILCKCE